METQKQMNDQQLVENWCRKRHRCWGLPLSVFGPAVRFYNFFRCMCWYYSRQMLVDKNIEKNNGHVIQYLFGTNKAYKASLLTDPEILLAQTKELQFEVDQKVIYIMDECDKYLQCYSFDAEDMTWTKNDPSGWSYLPYDLDAVLVKIAQLQVAPLRLPKDISDLIAAFAKERLTQDDVPDKKNECFMRNFKLRTKRKHMDVTCEDDL